MTSRCVNVETMVKRKAHKKWKLPKLKRPKPSNWQVCAKSFYLTYQCPYCFIVNPLTRMIILWWFYCNYPEFDVNVVAKEKNNNRPGTHHFHVFLQITDPTKGPFRSREWWCFDMYGVHPNFATRSDGNKKYSKHDWLEYIIKEDLAHDAVGIDIPLYLAEFEKKKCTKLSIIARDIYHNGLNLKRMCVGEYGSTVMMHQDKLERFDNTCREVKYVPMQPLKVPVNPNHHKILQKICKWWNYRCVDGKWKKKLHFLLLVSTFYSIGKSTLLAIMLKIMNGDTWTYEFNDKGWQEGFRKHHRILGIDALNGPFFPFSLYEKLGGNFQGTLKKRNCKQGNQFRGPGVITSNNSLSINYGSEEGKKQYNIDVLKERTLTLNLQNVSLFPLCNLFCQVHGLDPNDFKEDDDDFDISDDEDGFVIPMEY